MLRPAFDGQTLPLGLRPTLWHYLLRNTLVFVRGAHIHRFREALRQRRRPVPHWLKLYALDGESYNKMVGLEEPAGRQYTVSCGWGVVWLGFRVGACCWLGHCVALVVGAWFWGKGCA